MKINIVYETLAKALAKKQKRMEWLKGEMAKKHLDADTAKAMDSFAARFNAAKDGQAKMAIAAEWQETNDKWKSQVAGLKHQIANDAKWQAEYQKLYFQIDELVSEIGRKNLLTANR
jgi:hypothetical protein